MAKRSLTSRAIKFAVFLGVVYTMVTTGMFLLQRQFIYLPSPQTPTPEEFGVPEMEVVRIATEDGLSLQAWWHAPADAGAAVIVYFHGNAGHIGYRAAKIRPFLARGMGVLLVGYRGYGGNPGQPTETGLYADAAAAASFLEGRGFPSDRWVYYGESLGSGVAVEAASRWPGRGVVLEAPFSSLVEAAEARFPFLPLRWLMLDRYDSVDKIAAIGAPLLIFHGENDGVVPISSGRKLFDAAIEPKRFHAIPNAGHNDLPSFGIMNMTADFVDKISNRINK